VVFQLSQEEAGRVTADVDKNVANPRHRLAILIPWIRN
jgi:hypothetical protein